MTELFSDLTVCKSLGCTSCLAEAKVIGHQFLLSDVFFFSTESHLRQLFMIWPCRSWADQNWQILVVSHYMITGMLLLFTVTISPSLTCHLVGQLDWISGESQAWVWNQMLALCHLCNDDISQIFALKWNSLMFTMSSFSDMASKFIESI